MMRPSARPLALGLIALVLAPFGQAATKRPYRTTQAVREAGLEAPLEAGVARAETFFSAPFARSFKVEVAPDRAGLDRLFARRWGAPPTECWMVAAGVADTLFTLDPRVWTSQACEHDGADADHVAQIVAHELVHVYHGQRCPRPEFEGMDEAAWFAEGLAVLASGQLESRHRGAALEAAAAGALPTRLSDAWSGRYRYGVSGDLVAYLDRTYGRASLVRLLGATSNAEILSMLGTTEEGLLASWRLSVQSRRLESLAWMAGHWGAKEESGTSEEGWFSPRGTALVGVHRDVAPDGSTFFEYLRIEVRPEGLFYVASPMGQGATSFRMVASSERRAVFEDPDHDFPKRITYWREGDALFATAEGEEAGRPRSESWAWSLMP